MAEDEAAQAGRSSGFRRSEIWARPPPRSPRSGSCWSSSGWAAGAGFLLAVFPIAGMGIALAMQAFGIWGQKPISEEAIQREMGRGDPGA